MEPDETYYVFVYGTLRRGQDNHDMIEGRYTSVRAVTLEGFKIERIHGLPFASVCAGESIQGELYGFEAPEVLDDLDILEGYQIPGTDGNLYEREQISIDGVQAFIYLKGNPDL